MNSKKFLLSRSSSHSVIIIRGEQVSSVGMDKTVIKRHEFLDKRESGGSAIELCKICYFKAQSTYSHRNAFP